MVEWGVGLRSQHVPDWRRQAQRPRFEVLSDNYIFQSGGPALEYLAYFAAERAPLLHGVGLNIGGLEPLDNDYLQRLQHLKSLTKAKVISDHLCFCRNQGIETYDLLPIPYTRSELERVGQRVHAVQDFFGQQIALENISSYVKIARNTMTEIEFLLELVHRTGCSLLLDINNLYVSSQNLKWPFLRALELIDPSAVAYLHVSGFSLNGSVLYDSHDQAVSDPVLEGLGRWLQCDPNAIVILERDDSELPFAQLIEEWMRIQSLVDSSGSSNVISSENRSPSMVIELRDWDKSSSPIIKDGIEENLGVHRKQILGTQTCMGSETPEIRAESSNQDTHHAVQTVLMTELLAGLGLRKPLVNPSSVLSTDTAEHWKLYVNGVAGRWTSLVDSTFRRATHVWGREALATLLLDFACHRPPATFDMNRAFQSIPEFVEQDDEYRRVSGLADLLRACLTYWELLEGDDPIPVEQSQGQLDSRLVGSARCVIPRQSGLDLRELWLQAEEPVTDDRALSWQHLMAQETGILLVKVDALTVNVLSVTPILYPFYRALANGESIESAIGRLETSGQDSRLPLDTIEVELSKALHDLSIHSLLC